MSQSSLPSLPLPPDAIDANEAYQKSYATAVRLLARREHSVFELRCKLAARDIDDAIVDRVLGELSELGLLNDRRFADSYVRRRYERGYGPLRIQAELRERGVSADLTEKMLEEWSSGWIESARQLRYKRFGQDYPHDFTVKARQMRFLQQRGFTGEQIRAVFRH